MVTDIIGFMSVSKTPTAYVRMHQFANDVNGVKGVKNRMAIK